MSRNRFSFSKQVSLEEPAVNLTPLIDVVFVILIMFIVIAPLVELDQVELAQGPLATVTNGQSLKDVGFITIHVLKDNSIKFNTQFVTLSQLKTLLIQAKSKFPKEIPQIFHDKSAHFGTYQTVKNSVEEAGFSQMDIILKPA